MQWIQSIRYANLMIPNKTGIIQLNQSFDLTGEHTVFNLMNGGGKTSMIAMLLQVFKPNIKLQNHPFIGYLPPTGHGVVLVELKKNEQLFTLGIVARRRQKQVTDKQTESTVVKEDMQYYTFCTQYLPGSGIGYDLQSLPIYQNFLQTELKPFNELKQYLNKAPYGKVQVFETQRDHLAYLKQEFPEIETWVNLMTIINSNEGGVVNVFKNNEGTGENLIPVPQVLRRHFIPLIVSKRGHNEALLQEQFLTIAQDYAKVEEVKVLRDELARFKTNHLEPFRSLTEGSELLYEKADESYREVKQLLTFLRPLEQRVTDYLEDLKKQEQALQAQWADLLMQEASLDYWQKVDHCFVQEQRKDNAQTVHEQVKREKTELAEMMQRHLAARQLQWLKEKQNQLQLALNERDRRQVSQSEQMAQLTHLREVVATRIWEDKQRVNAERDTVNQQQAEHEQTLKLLESELVDMGETIGAANYRGEQLRQELETQLRHLESLQATFPPRANQMDEYQLELEAAQQTLETQSQHLRSQHQQLKSQQEALSQEIQQLKVVEAQQEEKWRQELATFKAMEQERDQLRLRLKHRLKEEGYALEEEDELHDLDAAIQRQNNELALWQEDVVRLGHQIDKPVGVELTPKFKAFLKEKGIVYQTGTEWLKELPSEERREAYLAEYPLLPFAIVVDTLETLESLRPLQLEFDEESCYLCMVNPAAYPFGPALSNGGWFRHFDAQTLKAEVVMAQREQLKQEQEGLKQRIEEGQSVRLPDYYQIRAGLLRYTREVLIAQEQLAFQCEDQLRKTKATLLVHQAEWNHLETHQQDLLCQEEAYEQALQQHQLASQQWMLYRQGLVQYDALQREAEQLEASLRQLKEKQREHLLIKQQTQGAQTVFLQQIEQIKVRLNQVKEWWRHYQLFYRADLTLTDEECERLIPSLMEEVATQQRALSLEELEQTIQGLERDAHALKEAFESYGYDAQSLQTLQYDEVFQEQLKRQYREKSEEVNQAAALEKEALDTYHQKKSEVESARAVFAATFKPRQTEPYARERLMRTPAQLVDDKTQIKRDQAEVSELQETYSKHQTWLQRQHQRFDLVDARLRLTQDAKTGIESWWADLTHYRETLERTCQEEQHHYHALMDAVETWEAAYQEAWHLSSEQRDILPRNLLQFKGDYPSVSTQNVLTILKGMAQLETMVQVRLERCNTQLEENDEQYRHYCHGVLNQCLGIRNDLLKFDKGLTIQLKETEPSQRLLRLEFSDELEDEAVKEAIQRYLDDQLTRLVSRLNEREDDHVATQNLGMIQYGHLLNAALNFNHVGLQVLKIENLGSALIEWGQTSSGGETSLQSIILIFAMFKYISRETKGMSIIMDNPFGIMSSSHLVEPMFVVADKLAIQLVCFTAIKEEAIIQLFEKIYALKQVPVNENEAYLAQHQLEHGFYSATARPDYDGLILEDE